MKTLKRILFFIAGICLLVACSKSDLFSDDDFNVVNLNEMNLKSLVVSSAKSYADEICLQGTSNFDVYAPKEGRVVVNPAEMYLTMDATLTHIEGQNYLLTTTETLPPDQGGPLLYRIIEFNVKISEGGAVKFLWPDSWWELGTTHSDLAGQFLDHTGCIGAGPGLNKSSLAYNGYFDGVNFYAAMHITAKQVQDPIMPVYIGLIGPIKFVFSMTLNKVDCTESK
jgi:hypothetical protein